MSRFFGFFATALGIYALVNAYILRRAFQGLAGFGWANAPLRALLVVWALSYPVGRVAERLLPSANFPRTLVVWGSVYLGFMVTTLFLFAAADIAFLAGRLAPGLPIVGHRGPAAPALRRTVLLAVAVLSALIVGLGAVNSRFPRVREATVALKGPAGRPLRVVLFSDLHMGPLMGNGRVRSLVRKVNALSPDVVLLVGDIVDEDISRLAEERMAEALRDLSPKLGSFAVTGNHEYYAGEEEAVSYLESAGITVLRDQAVVLDGRLILAGRKDLTAARFGGSRLPLPKILEGLPEGKPVLLMDHQPRNLEEAEATGVSLQVSGHTHNGQIFPFNFVTSRIYEVSRGWGSRGNTKVLVSSGVGTWGPPMRTSAAPEIWVLTLEFTGDR